MAHYFNTGHYGYIVDPSQTKRYEPCVSDAWDMVDHRSGNDRRTGWGILAFYLVGGLEQRYIKNRRHSEKQINNLEMLNENRSEEDRRRKIKTKYLHLGKCIDRRNSVRRINDQPDHDAIKREKYKRLGPGWL